LGLAQWHILLLQISGDLGELVEGGGEVLGDFEGDDVGIGKIGGILEAVVCRSSARSGRL
jgi:hypothetical protein